MNEKIQEALTILESLKEINPGVNFSELEECILRAKEEDDNIFYQLNKDDLIVCFEDLIENTKVADLSEEIKDEFLESLFRELNSNFSIEDWIDLVKDFIGKSIDEDSGYYICKNINPECATKWGWYKLILSTIDVSHRSEETIANIEKMENLHDAIYDCLEVFTADGLSDELDTALEEVRKFERDGFITFEQYESICDLWFRESVDSENHLTK